MPANVLTGTSIFSVAKARHFRGGENVENHNVRGLAITISLFAGFCAVGIGNVGTLKNGSAGATVTGSLPGQVLWTDYYLYDGDSIIRLINPNGGANTGITGISEHPVCAMVYVFDDEQEMEECCGCPISSAGLLSFSVAYNLQSNGIYSNAVSVATEDIAHAALIAGITITEDQTNGVIAIVAAAPNPDITTLASPSNGLGCTVGQSGSCNFGCDPTNNPGYTVTTANNLLGSRILTLVPSGMFAGGGLLETALHDDGSSDPNNITYLQHECGELVGNGSGAGTCGCPVPGDSQQPLGG